MRPLTPLDTTFSHDGGKYLLSVTKYAYTMYRWDISVWNGDLVMAELGLEPGSWVECSVTPDLIKSALKAVHNEFQKAPYRAKVKPRKIAFSNLISELKLNSIASLKVECFVFRID